MDYEKIGLFIKRLREKANLTQEALANVLHISRQSVSKWERGLTIPDASTLVLLSEIFSVSINEILAGEVLTKENSKEIENITLEVLEDKQIIKKRFKNLLIIFLISITIFLLYYFINSYNRFRVYTISGTNNEQELFNGLIVSTGNKLYIQLLKTQEFAINNLKLYYKNENKKEIILYESDDDYISLINFYGIDTNLKLSDLKYLKENLYLVFNDTKIHLKVIEDYQNNKLFFKKNTYINNDKDSNETANMANSYGKLDNKISNLDNLASNNIFYQNKEYNLMYIKDRNLIKLNIAKEEYRYNLANKTLHYKEIKDNKITNNFILKENICLEGECETKKIEKFWRYIDETFK